MDEDSEPKPSFVRRLSMRLSKRRKREEAPKFEEITKPAGYEKEDLHTLMKRLKQEVTQLKVLHKEWEKPTKRPKLEPEFKELADHVYTYASMIAKRVGIPTVQKEIIEEREREICSLRAEIQDLKNSRDNDKRIKDRESEIFRLKREIQTLNGELQSRRQSESDQQSEGENNRRYSRGRLVRKEDNSAPDTSKYIIHDLKEQVEKLREESESAKQSLNVVKGENEDLKQQVQRVREDNQELSKRCGEYSKQIGSLRDKLQDFEKENQQPQGSQDENIARLHQDIENYKDQIRRLSRGSYKRNKEDSNREKEYREEVEKISKSNKELSFAIKKNEETIDRLQRQLKREKDAKNEALTRLSEKASEQIQTNNPGIQDLSDPDRPIKLAEKISELYDNEWTNSMENLESLGFSEKDSLTLLLKILAGVYQMCERVAGKQILMISKCLSEPPVTDDFSTSDNKSHSLPVDVLKALTDYRKTTSRAAVPYLIKALRKELLKSIVTEEQSNACEEYINKCVQYCWAMNIHKPPVHIVWDFEEGSDFNNAIMRSYTKCGKLVDFMVWPVLYLHKDGPLLGKGVAQGKSIDSAV